MRVQTKAPILFRKVNILKSKNVTRGRAGALLQFNHIYMTLHTKGKIPYQDCEETYGRNYPLTRHVKALYGHLQTFDSTTNLGKKQ